jgi:hypothetical protein
VYFYKLDLGLMGGFLLIRRKSKIIGRTRDEDNREYIAVKRNGNLIIHVKASDIDIDNINNYSSNCITNINYNTKQATFENCFDIYVKYISEDFDRYNYDLLSFISRYIYAGRVKGFVINSYKKYIKTHVMFSVHFQVDEILEFGDSHRFKV